MQIEAAAEDASPAEVRSMLSCLAAFAASGQMAARLAAATEARASGSTPSHPPSTPSETPMLVVGRSADSPPASAPQQASSPSQLLHTSSGQQEAPPNGAAQAAASTSGALEQGSLSPVWPSASARQPSNRLQPGQQLQEPAVLAAVHRCGRCLLSVLRCMHTTSS